MTPDTSDFRRAAVGIADLEATLVDSWRETSTNTVWTAESAYRRGVEDAGLSIVAAHRALARPAEDENQALLELAKALTQVLAERGLLRV